MLSFDIRCEFYCFCVYDFLSYSSTVLTCFVFSVHSHFNVAPRTRYESPRSGIANVPTYNDPILLLALILTDILLSFARTFAETSTLECHFRRCCCRLYIWIHNYLLKFKHKYTLEQLFCFSFPPIPFMFMCSTFY